MSLKLSLPTHPHRGKRKREELAQANRLMYRKTKVLKSRPYMALEWRKIATEVHSLKL